MVSCIEIETASLVFAILSLLLSFICTLVCVALTVHINVLMTYLIGTAQRSVRNISELEIAISNYGLYINVGLAVAIVISLLGLIFTILLTKGLVSKKAHLVKAYFIYGVTANIISALLAFISILIFSIPTGSLSLFGCLLYSFILIMIKRTYVKMSTTGYDQFGQKKLEAEKPIA